MAPLKPHWPQPSHPDIQEVIIGSDGGEFSSKSVSRVAVAPNGVYARLTFPPCTFVDESSYATVQVGPDRHIHLNSDLLYLNHSCEPSLVSVTHISFATPHRQHVRLTQPLDHRHRTDAGPRRSEGAGRG